MRILFDQGTPTPLRNRLHDHEVMTAYELAWDTLSNGDLLMQAETRFDLLITTDQSLVYQQNLTGRQLAILVLPTTSWPIIRYRVDEVISAVSSIQSGEFRQLVFADAP